MSSHTNSFDATQAPTKSRRLWMALILGALTAFGPLSIDMYLPSLPALTGDLNTSTSLVQISLTACLLGLAFGQLLVGPLSDARGRRKPLIVALIIYAISSLLCAISSSIWVLIALRVVQGVSGAAGIVISRAMVRDMYSGSELTKFFSLLMLVNGVAPILAPITGGLLLEVTSWRGVFVVLSILGAIMLLGALFGLPETLPIQRRSTGGIKGTLSTFRSLIGDRVFMGYALSQGLVLAAMFGYISGSPFVLQNIYGVSPQTFSVLFAINGLGIIIASQITGRLAGKVSETRLLVTGLGLAALGGILLLIMILIGARLLAVMIPLFFVVSSVGVVTTTGFSLAMQNQERSAGSASALLGLLPFVFGAIAAPLVGLGGSHTAVPMGIVIAVSEVGAIVCYALMVRRR
ncbi:multidrug effflux MFS transporter [Aneurinibacillus aneurinilyticus]|uniref:Bcr/CflA family efflux transporter n=2 Tax=Aneurinibacillus aneurinilyticus TaxID=1391 RepID=A0A848CMD8_ANEAE|nr:multidrug effflux MFS transporter [Aneurinibacillus aneurinilyticus]MCI1696094.1 multidrug effflux MFS transporter [Aneurinibacillus aneurinilyticus]MED0706258.1 multidrug effflux MFS transporter [Aneurinibacillus aneurinilyticus]MED0724212.1 multidrug effflux MFS transporter [Aneurinibacillus aneurinilyticus]MED0732256.1 multidrug effflux MFS transporter [Aneurinibacillus aneurinilyticus]MED0741727.1 multidrug effflux MFS transporter [Aneurinibacillus aneurinilyticus]